MEVTLQILHGWLKSGTGVPKVEGFTIRQPRFVIGSDVQCNMVCRSRLVSPRHCQITLSDRQVTLEDLASEHGTFVNGIRLDGSQVLKTGDMLKIGRLEFFVSLGPPPTSPPPSEELREAAAPAAHDTVNMSAATSDTLVDAPHTDAPHTDAPNTDAPNTDAPNTDAPNTGAPHTGAPADGRESVDDLVSQLLEEADEKDRELRRSDPAARYLKVESPAPSSKEAETAAAEAEKDEKRKRPPRKRPIKLPADKLVQGPHITGKDSVNAAEQALDELLRSPKK